MKNRVLSGVVLISFIVAIVCFNDTFPMALNIALALVSVLGVWEIISALGMAKNYILTVPSLLFAVMLPLFQEDLWRQILYYAYVVLLFSGLVRYHKSATFREVGIVFSMTLMIPTALDTLIGLRNVGGEHGMFYVIIAIFAAWIADTGAFFAGSLFGKHKLCPEISPKKTVEGVVGAFVLNIAAMLVFGYVFQAFYYQHSVQVSYLTLVVIGVGSAATSILGDLSFSLIKRSCHIKDFGQMIPGHGGILDRFDSVIFTAPFVFILVQMMPMIVG